MGRRKKYMPRETNFVRQEEALINGHLFTRGDVIKIQGEWGSKFKFDSFVTNKISGAEWVDCFELIKGVPSVFRSFRIERVKRIPKKRGKRVKADVVS
jgi:hypothetical protein